MFALLKEEESSSAYCHGCHQCQILLEKECCHWLKWNTKNNESRKRRHKKDWNNKTSNSFVHLIITAVTTRHTSSLFLFVIYWTLQLLYILTFEFAIHLCIFYSLCLSSMNFASFPFCNEDKSERHRSCHACQNLPISSQILEVDSELGWRSKTGLLNKVVKEPSLPNVFWNALVNLNAKL